MNVAESLPPTPESLRILLVDDELCIRHILSASLRVAGHFVETAGDGVDALERFEKAEWDVVITDRAMPRMDGEQLAAEIKRRRHDMPVIMITGLTGAVQPETRERIDALLPKPFSSEALCTAIARARERVAQHCAGGEHPEFREAA